MGKRPGFRREKPLYKLNFETEDLDGLVVMAKSMPLRDFLFLVKVSQNADTGDPGAIEEMYQKIAAVLVSWNLEDEGGEPVPATYEGLARQDLQLANAIVGAYQQALAEVPKSSPTGSSGSGTSAELSIPMEAP